MLKKINYVLNRKQKFSLLILLVVIFVGAFVELLGVSAIMPIIEVAMNPAVIYEKWYLTMIMDTMGFTNADEVLVFWALFLIVIYILKNIYVTMMYNMQY
ncbi:MAG: ABC transporter ATP-binding protein, partial [Lachnospiraceae bacterium]|nr:ABC transporter ATP-binding protein [Lachnospiraceae bacterium]